MTKTRAVIKLGGALFKRDPDTNSIKKTMETLTSPMSNPDDRLIIVAGGGENARIYITAARKLGADESTCDIIGITITRVNAELLKAGINPNIKTAIATSLEQLSILLTSNTVIIIGGLQPGQSTNAVAALAAEISRASILVYATDVDGVYNEDPKKNPKARMLEKVDAALLLKMSMSGEIYAGRYELLDPLAIKVIQRSKIQTRFVSLLDPRNIIDAVNGRSVGTLVTHGGK